MLPWGNAPFLVTVLLCRQHILGIDILAKMTSDGYFGVDASDSNPNSYINHGAVMC